LKAAAECAAAEARRDRIWDSAGELDQSMRAADKSM